MSIQRTEQTEKPCLKFLYYTNYFTCIVPSIAIFFCKCCLLLLCFRNSVIPRAWESQFYFHHTTYSLLFSHYIMSNSLQPHELQHTRLPCPSLSPRVARTHVHEAVMPSHHPILAIMKNMNV